MLAFQRKLDRRKITQAETEEVKAELSAERKVVPVWRDLREGHVVSSPMKEPSMTFWMEFKMFNESEPVLKNDKPIT